MDKKSLAKQAISLMDLTSLNDDDTNDVIAALCERASTPAGTTAAICIFPQFISFAKTKLTELGLENVKIATVTNFPKGGDDIAAAVAETQEAVKAGADEVDVVYPFNSLLGGDRETGKKLVAQCKDACGDKVRLKVIIETGVLKDEALIRTASIDCIDAGADFIKTSTGKVAVNATPEAARIMLEVIRDHNPKVGFKPAGGMKVTEDAGVYINLAKEILGNDWVNPTNFRLGASSLLADLLQTLGVKSDVGDSGGY